MAATTIDFHPFHVRIPREVRLLRKAGALSARDLDVLAALLDFKNKGRTTVEPRLKTLAKGCQCCVKTIQRAIDKLEKAGLIVTSYARDARGRIKSLVFDLAVVIEMARGKKSATATMPFSRKTPMSFGGTVGAGTNHAQNGASAARKSASPKDIGGGTQKQESDDQATTTAAEGGGASSETETALRRMGVNPDAAKCLAADNPAERIWKAIDYVLGRHNVQRRAGYVRSLLEKTDFGLETVTMQIPRAVASPPARAAQDGAPGERFSLLPSGSSRKDILAICKTKGYGAVLDEMESRHRLSNERRESPSILQQQKDALDWLREKAVEGGDL